MGARPVTFLSDYGREDDFVGVCHAVMVSLVPEIRIIDITHGLPRHQVRPGAVVMANTLPYAPPGVHLAVVDPGVGSDRRPVAVRVADDERVLVGPDNGVLSLATERLGGAVEAVDLALSAFRLEPLSATFHGRDLFAPVTARIAAGAGLEEAGEPIDPASLEALALPRPSADGGGVNGHVLYVDRFGNVALNLGQEQLLGTELRLGAKLEVQAGSHRFFGMYARTFDDVRAGEILLYEDAYRSMALAINRGDAALTMQLAPDDPVTLRPAT